MLISLIFAIVYIVVTYKWGDWRNWQLYYPTILFYGFGDILAFSLFYQQPLWLYFTPNLPHLFHELFVVIIMYSCSVILFLSNYPKALVTQCLYILFWSSLYTFLEWFAIRIGNFIHLNGWSLAWSFLLYMIMFPTLQLHQKRPLLALCILFGGLALLLYLFRIPVELVK